MISDKSPEKFSTIKKARRQIFSGELFKAQTDIGQLEEINSSNYLPFAVLVLRLIGRPLGKNHKLKVA
ncbi:MAG: hypothetical protein ACRCTY_01365 [Candidatus Adiutrix sp.]